MAEGKRPNSRRNLDIAIDRLAAGTQDPLRLRIALANTIVGQMIPEGAVKGGSSLKMRYGDGATRFTRDLDIARVSDMEEYARKLEASLKEGWEGFTGTLVRREPAKPRGVPGEYVMQPYDIKLSYNEKPWCTVPLEIGHDEIGDAEDPDRGIAREIVDAFVALGFPEPKPVPLMRIEHQVAQKLHAASGAGSARAHDLVDLQLIVARESVDYSAVRQVCRRLFAYRRQQAWPPTMLKGDDWDELYLAQSEGLEVLPTVDDAIEWANDLVNRIEESESS
jgi:predicted nucleotidyltransferase component of viral defense system